MIYDAVGNLYTRPTSIPKFSSTAWTDSFTNDNLDELKTEATTGDGPSNTYSYDAALNPTSFRGTATTTPDADHQFPVTSYNVFDGDGNPTTYEGATFGFDPEDRLTGIGTSFLAGYDGDGLRSWKNAGGSSAKTYFLYEGDTPIVELGSTGSIAAVNTDGEFGLISRHTVSTNKSVFYGFDPEGSVNAIESSGGTLNSTLLYDAYGKLIQSTGGGAQPPFGFGAQWGYYTDAESGLQLLTHRYYDAGAGRFINRDPIGQGGGANVYGYVDNKPTFAFDERGTDGATITWGSAVKTAVGTGTTTDEEMGGPANPVGNIIALGIMGVILGNKLGNVIGDHYFGTQTYKSYGPVSLRPCASNAAPIPPKNVGESPGPDWEWKGNGPPVSGKGAWYNPKTRESLHPDLSHSPPIGPHWDYKPGPGQPKVRIPPTQ